MEQTHTATRTAVLQRAQRTIQIVAQRAAHALTWIGQLLILSLLSAGWLTYTLAHWWHWSVSTSLFIFLLLVLWPLLTLGPVYWSLQTLLDVPAQLSDLMARTQETATSLRTQYTPTADAVPSSRWSALISIGKAVLELKAMSDEVTELLPLVNILTFIASPLFFIALASGAGMTLLLFIIALIIGI